MKKTLLVLILIGLAITERLWWDLGPNVELVTLVTFLAGIYLDKKATLAIPLLSLAISDIFLGNTSIMLFTWSAYMVIALIPILIKFLAVTSVKRIVLATVGGIFGSLWFYVWTNFGVWILDSWDMYPKTWQGLLTCYINGLPFLRNQLAGNVIVIPLVFSCIEALILINNLLKQKQARKHKLTVVTTNI